MRRAVAEARENAWPAEGWESAEAALREARSLEGAIAEYPYDTFFHYTLQLLQTVRNRHAALNEQLSQVWNQWHTSCLTLDAVSKSRVQPILDEVQPKWEIAMRDSV